MMGYEAIHETMVQDIFDVIKYGIEDLDKLRPKKKTSIQKANSLT